MHSVYLAQFFFEEVFFTLIDQLVYQPISLMRGKSLEEMGFQFILKLHLYFYR
jgi:hypothetical protein